MRPVKTFKQALLNTLQTIDSVRPRHWRALRIARVQARGASAAVKPASEHLARAIAWLKRAQDVTGSGGVSWGFCARPRLFSGFRYGWQPAYPETTGYIIETMLRYARLVNDEDARRRARRMADWELAIQLPDGGIPGGTVATKNPRSSTFVTGQVIFGLLGAFAEFQDPAYLAAARRAGDYLLGCLDPQGRFQAGWSDYCAPGPKAYEARTGWALAQLAVASGLDKYAQAARNIGHFALSCRQPGGWFAQNDLDFHDRPLTHTIGYVLEGLQGIGALLREPAFLDAMQDSLERIRPLVREDGFLAGRWEQGWKPAVPWSCLTGSCQLAGVCIRAGRPDFLQSAGRLLGFVTGAQFHGIREPGLQGGIPGSYPFSGAYGSYSVLNWAVKFYADAVMDFLAAEAPRAAHV